MKEEDKNQETFEEWKAGFEGLSFEESAIRYKDKIMESPELDAKSRKYFEDAFNYVMDLHRRGKPLETKLMKIHMTEIKNYKAFTLEEFGRTLLLLNLCGFSFEEKH